MYCPKCGAQNPEDTRLCTACSWVLSSTSTVAAVPASDAKTSPIAITSLILGILSVFTCMLTALPAIICGIISLVKISGSGGQLKGKGLAIAGIATPAAALPIIALLMAIMMPALGKSKGIVQQKICESNLNQLSVAMFVYTHDYDDKFPPADQWCDLLISEVDVSPQIFNCKNTSLDSVSYGLNKNLNGLRIGDLPPDMVMIFEIAGGRNIAGGPEMLETQRHGGRGCNIAFADGHVEFVRVESIGQLKWGTPYKPDTEDEQSQQYPEY